MGPGEGHQGPRAGWERHGPQPKGSRMTAKQSRTGVPTQTEAAAWFSVRSCVSLPKAPEKGGSEEGLDFLLIELVGAQALRCGIVL